MKLLFNLSIVLVICASGCKDPLHTRKFELTIIVADSISSPTLPNDLLRICVPIQVDDTLLLLANIENRSPVLTKIGNPTIRQFLYTPTENLLSNVFKANENPGRLAKQVEKNLEDLRVGTSFKKATEQAAMLRSVDSLLRHFEKTKNRLLIFGKNGTDTTYNGHQVYHNPESLQNSIVASLTADTKIKSFTVLYGLDLSILSNSMAADTLVSATNPTPKVIKLASNTVTRKPVRKPIPISVGPVYETERINSSPVPKSKNAENSGSILDGMSDQDARSRKVKKGDMNERRKDDNHK